jgi:hypothetical protein
LPRLREHLDLHAARAETRHVELREPALERADHQLLRDPGRLRGHEPGRDRASGEQQTDEG